MNIYSQNIHSGIFYCAYKYSHTYTIIIYKDIFSRYRTVIKMLNQFWSVYRKLILIYEGATRSQTRFLRNYYYIFNISNSHVFKYNLNMIDKYRVNHYRIISIIYYGNFFILIITSLYWSQNCDLYINHYIK